MCHERTGVPRAWTNEETLVCHIGGNLVTLAYEAKQRQEAEKALVMARGGRVCQSGQERFPRHHEP